MTPAERSWSQSQFDSPPSSMSQLKFIYQLFKLVCINLEVQIENGVTMSKEWGCTWVVAYVFVLCYLEMASEPIYFLETSTAFFV